MGIISILYQYYINIISIYISISIQVKHKVKSFLGNNNSNEKI